MSAVGYVSAAGTSKRPAGAFARTGLTYRSRGQEKKPPSADGVLHARGTHRLIRVCPIRLAPWQPCWVTRKSMLCWHRVKDGIAVRTSAPSLSNGAALAFLLAGSARGV